MKSYQAIFDKDPECGFGLRGDVYMWNMFRAATRNWLGSGEDDIDGLQRNLTAMVSTLYRIATGVALAGTGTDTVPFFARVGYGMSKGCCVREWWLTKGLPLLRQRLDDCVGDCTDGKYNLLILQTDIIARDVDAIVCPSNTDLQPKGGLGGAIMTAAGPAVAKECRAIPKDADGCRCPVGEVRMTGAGRLKCRHVIHAVGPNCQRGVTEEAKDELRRCYQKIAKLAEAENFEVIALPSIGTGKNAFPVDEAARIAAAVISRECCVRPARKFVFCIPDAKTAAAFRRAFRDAARE